MAIKFNRILWLVPTSSSETYNSNMQGLQMLGAAVLPINYREKTLVLGIGGARNELLQIIDEFTPDLILFSFFSDTYELSPEFLREVSSKAPLVVHPGDDELLGTWQTIYFAQSADAVMTPDYGGRFMYEQLLIPAVYFVSPVLDFLDSLPTVEKSIDVSFIGDVNKADRGDYIKYLQENGIGVETYGSGSENGFVSRVDYLKILRRSKINLNFTGRPIPRLILSREPWRKHFKALSCRAFEAARMKSFCLSEYCLGLNEILSIGSEVDVFHDKEELLRKVKYYLENDSKREDMAARAFNKVKKEFGDLEYLSRTYNLLHERLRDRKGAGKRNPLFRSFYFDASEVKANFLIFLKLLRLRRFALAFGVIPYFFKFKMSCLVGLWRGMIEAVLNRFCPRKEPYC
tara:strand:+ start:827 stop:2035 length:1209 start_codon:yes stop_codon:yes gene_type:complete